MAKADGGSARPRGTKPVHQAFFTALDALPAPQQAAVGKAALAMIRDEIRNRRDKDKAMAAKAKASQAKRAAPAARPPRRTPAKAAPPEPVAPTEPAPKRRRSAEAGSGS